MGTLTLEDLVKEVEFYCQLDKPTAKKVVYAIFGSMIKELKAGGKVTLYGFGIWSPHTRKAHRKYSKFLGDYMTVPEKKTVKFKYSKHLRYLVDPDYFTNVPEKT